MQQPTESAAAVPDHRAGMYHRPPIAHLFRSTASYQWERRSTPSSRRSQSHRVLVISWQRPSLHVRHPQPVPAWLPSITTKLIPQTAMLACGQLIERSMTLLPSRHQVASMPRQRRREHSWCIG